MIPELPGFNDPNAGRPVHQRRRSTSAARATRSAAPTRSTTTSSNDRFLQPALDRRTTTRSAAASASSTRPTTCRARSSRRTCPRTAASTSRSRWPASARSPTCSARSAASRAADAPRGAAVPLSSPVQPDSPAATWSITCSRASRASPRWGHGPVPAGPHADSAVSPGRRRHHRRRGGRSGARQSRGRSAVLPLCRASPTFGSTWSRLGDGAAGQRMGTHNLLDGAATSRARRARCWSPDRRSSTGRRSTALTEDSPIGPASPYGVSKLAQEIVGARRAARRRHRHAAVQPRRSTPGAGLRDVQLRAADRRDRGGLREPVLQRRQPRRAPRHHRRARYGAGLPAADGARPRRGGPTTSAAGGRIRVGDLLDALSASRTRPCEIRTDPGAAAAERQAGRARRPAAACSRTPAGCRRSPSNKRSPTCSTTGGSVVSAQRPSP